MKKIVIYTKNYCPYCKMASAMLKRKGADFTEVDVTNDEDTFKVAKEKSGSRTVPQIFIDDKFIGGFDDLAALESSGDLVTTLGL
ncbi:putative glutaredoxin [Gottschalkia acidurici 9a]|uniref:Glutaredoxin n=1 Tax=Gottschalkia acidurici (strain ATCC 7906 / DSM 604 / BCRC 14475 / CIP 104303 / KCTC 5404 / NCIMB 10678 / 9a) TaxID=1128398 RepID=K0AYI6_GOTA9|nr:glutaredoxin 3 [Gottschalkia acidurici]AFS77805.1 putative glutaredoxin [Gottschalkia acidurici 9a]